MPAKLTLRDLNTVAASFARWANKDYKHDALRGAAPLLTALRHVIESDAEAKGLSAYDVSIDFARVSDIYCTVMRDACTAADVMTDTAMANLFEGLILFYYVITQKMW